MVSDWYTAEVIPALEAVREKVLADRILSPVNIICPLTADPE